MKFVAIEHRKMPLGFRYVAVQLGAPPFYALAWFTWLWWCGAFIAAKNPFGEPIDRGFELNIGSVGLFLLGCLYLSDIVSACFRASGRQWLFSGYRNDEKMTFTASARFMVRTVPVLASIAVLVFWISW